MKTSSWNSYWKEGEELEYWQKPASSVIKFIKKCNPVKQPKVLDLGCGIGRHAIVFAKKGFEVTAVDNSKQALKELANKLEDIDLDIKIMKANYLESIFALNSFNIILSYNVIYHGSRENFKQAINLCQKYLKPEGIFFFTCPTRKDGKYGSGEKVAPHTYKSLNSVHPGDIHYFADKNDIKNLVKDFEIVSLKRNESYWDNEGTKQFSSYWEVVVKKY